MAALRLTREQLAIITGGDPRAIKALEEFFATLNNLGSHHATHEPGGSDPMAVDAAVAVGSLRTLGTGAAQAAAGNHNHKLDDLAAPDDNTDLNASATAHGLLPKLSGASSDALLGDGTWGALAGSKGHLHGLTLSNGADATNDIDIATGEAVDNGGGSLMVLASALTKQLDAAWAVGTNAGGRDTGAITDGWWAVWLIKRPDTGVVDVLFSLSATAPTMPTNYTLKRRIGWINRAAGTIRAFAQSRDRFDLKAVVVDRSRAAVPNTSRNVLTITAPPSTEARITVNCGIAAAADIYGWILPTTYTNAAASSSNYTINVYATGQRINQENVIAVDASSQIAYRGASTNLELEITTKGWIDDRGRSA